VRNSKRGAKEQRRLAGGMMVLRMQRNKLRRAQESVKVRNAQRAAEEAAAAKAAAEAEAAAKAAEGKEATEVTEVPETKVEQRVVAAIPEEISLDNKKQDTPLPRYGRVRKERLNPEVPVVTLDGVRISWADILDAEYAASWPEAVQHYPMGLFRHTAPKPWAYPRTVDYMIQAYGNDPELDKELEEQAVQLDGEANEEGGEDPKEDGKGGDGKGEGEGTEKEGEGKDSQTKPASKLKSWFGGAKTNSSERARV